MFLRCSSALALLAVVGCSTSSPRPAAQPAPAVGVPTRVILIIGDGVGLAQWSAIAMASESLAVKRLPVVGLVDTRCACRHLTDSGAAATAFAIGELSPYVGIGIAADSTPRTTVLEWAERRGMATGLVTTTAITDATPAAFAAHVVNRSQQAEIAAQMLAQNIEVMLGGGRGWFDGSLRPDRRNLLLSLNERYSLVTSREQFAALQPDTVRALLGLFVNGVTWPDSLHMRPSLPHMARTALEVLDRDPDGFFLLLESEDTDDIGHDTLSYDRLVAGMRELDDAVAVAVEYQQRNPETLILVTGDHETGGLGLLIDPATGELRNRYVTTGHTATMLPLFAGGPGAERFGGILTNAEVGKLLRDAVAPGAPARP